MELFYQVKSFFESIGLPVELLLICVLVIIFTEKTKECVKYLEDYLEDKKQKQIKIFDHTKIIFLIFWSIIGNIVLVTSGKATWNNYVMDLFITIGVCITCYELVVKKIQKAINE